MTLEHTVFKTKVSENESFNSRDQSDVIMWLAAQRSVPMMIRICPILLLISGVCLGGDVVLSPEPVYGTVGGSVWINTTIRPTNKPLRVIWWRFKDTKVVSSSPSQILPGDNYRDRIKLDASTGSLQLWDLAVSDSGEYGVTIKKTENDPAITDRVTLIVSEKGPGSDKSAGDTSDDTGHSGGDSTGQSGVSGTVIGVLIGVGIVVGFVAVVVYLYKKGTFTQRSQNNVI